MRSNRRQGNGKRVTALILAATGLVSTACAAEQLDHPLERAIAFNESRHVATRFEEHPVVIDDTQGVRSVRQFFTNAETLVISDATIEAQLRAASIAVAAHAPMLVYDPSRRQEILQEMERLKTHTVLTVGDVALAQTSGRVKVNRDPGGLLSLGEMTSVRFKQRTVAYPELAAIEVAQLDPQHPVWLRAAWEQPAVLPGAEAKPFPIMSRRDGHMAPVVVATRQSSIASIANARSFGADVTMVNNPDPRESEQTLFAMAGLADEALIALGGQFGTDEELAMRIMQAQESYLAENSTSRVAAK